jgi:hypothetical protein
MPPADRVGELCERRLPEVGDENCRAPKVSLAICVVREAIVARYHRSNHQCLDQAEHSRRNVELSRIARA